MARAVLEGRISKLIYLLANKLLQAAVRERDIHPGRLHGALETTPTLSLFEQTIEVPHLPRSGNTRTQPLDPPLRSRTIINLQKQQTDMVLIETRNHITLNFVPRQQRPNPCPSRLRCLDREPRSPGVGQKSGRIPVILHNVPYTGSWATHCEALSVQDDK